MRTFKHFLIWANPGLFFVYFPFSHQVESNSDRTDPSRPLYPLDHHHSPTFKQFNAMDQLRSEKSY